MSTLLLAYLLLLIFKLRWSILEKQMTFKLIFLQEYMIYLSRVFKNKSRKINNDENYAIFLFLLVCTVIKAHSQLTLDSKCYLIFNNILLIYLEGCQWSHQYKHCQKVFWYIYLFWIVKLFGWLCELQKTFNTSISAIVQNLYIYTVLNDVSGMNISNFYTIIFFMFGCKVVGDNTWVTADISCYIFSRVHDWSIYIIIDETKKRIFPTIILA